MIWFEDEKRRRNLTAGYEETKGLKDGHCNRRACQAPLAGRPQSSMEDHELMTDGRLYYCLPCTRRFDDADEQFQPHLPKRCRREPFTAAHNE
jgi:hypothetical protein